MPTTRNRPRQFRGKCALCGEFRYSVLGDKQLLKTTCSACSHPISPIGWLHAVAGLSWKQFDILEHLHRFGEIDVTNLGRPKDCRVMRRMMDLGWVVRTGRVAPVSRDSADSFHVRDINIPVGTGSSIWAITESGEDALQRAYEELDRRSRILDEVDAEEAAVTL